MVQVISREPGGNLYAKFDPRKNGAPTGEKGFCHSFIRQFTRLILTRFITLIAWKRHFCNCFYNSHCYWKQRLTWTIPASTDFHIFTAVQQTMLLRRYSTLQRHITRGAIRHVVQGIQMKAIDSGEFNTPLLTYDLWASMIEDRGDGNKEYTYRAWTRWVNTCWESSTRCDWSVSACHLEAVRDC